MAAFGDLDTSTLNRVHDELVQAGGRYVDMLNAKTNLAKQQQAQATSQEALSALMNVYKNPKASPEEVMRGTLEAHSKLASIDHPIATKTASTVDKLAETFSKFHPTRVNAPRVSLRDPEGKLTIVDHAGSQYQKKEIFDPEHPETSLGYSFVPHNPPGSRTGGGRSAAELNARKQTVEIPFLEPDPNKRTQGVIKTEKYTGQPEEISKRLVYEAVKLENELKPYTQLPAQAGSTAPALDLNQYVDGTKKIDIDSPDIQRITDLDEQRKVVAMVQAWQNLINQARQYATRGVGAQKADLSTFQGAQAATAPVPTGQTAQDEGGGEEQAPATMKTDYSGMDVDALIDAAENDPDAYAELKKRGVIQ
jgi:hypothetical protein